MDPTITSGEQTFDESSSPSPCKTQNEDYDQ